MSLRVICLVLGFLCWFSDPSAGACRQVAAASGLFPDSVITRPARPVYLGNNFVPVTPGETLQEIVGKAANVTPSARQYEWQRMEFAAFIHFSINTFTGREWGEGNEDPGLFNPSRLDARQWVRVIRDAGMKMVILTAKHHDGFCLWPSRFTGHTVAASPWRGGRGDLVKEVADACREYGLKFGVYLSPWDKHEPSYGDSPAYNEFFRNQLRELLTGYGEIAEVWFDGACGEGPGGRRQVYDWPPVYAMIRELQPGAVIAIMGPDVRWVGTESGYGRVTEWSVVPGNVTDPEKVAASSQQDPVDGAFIPRDLTGDDLGSRKMLENATSLAWYPAETDVSVRPGWFYRPEEDKRVKSPSKLADIYFSSVGRNSLLLLNVPPDRRGLIHENDCKSLKGLRKILDDTFRANLLEGVFSSLEGNAIVYSFPKPARFNVAMLQEEIRSGQRIEAFHFEAWTGGSWKEFAGGSTVGFKRLLRFPDVETDRVRLVIDASREEPVLSNAGLFLGPKELFPARQVPVMKYKVDLRSQYSEKYPAGGPWAIVDGIRGGFDFMDGTWQGYEGTDLEAVIDLGSVRTVKSVSAGFLQQQESWIFMPVEVGFSVSDDGITYRPAGMIKNDVEERAGGPVKQDFTLKIKKTKARYIRIHAENRGTCPAWHPGAGGKAWIFADEVEIKLGRP